MPDRKTATITTGVLYTLATVFLLVAVLGSVNGTSTAAAALSHIYFFKLDLSSIIPTSVNNAVLLNSVARSMGLHDFYQVGLWNFCEGYIDEYVVAVSCSWSLWLFVSMRMLGANSSCSPLPLPLQLEG